MQKRFEGLNHDQFKIFEPFLPSQRTGRGRPYAKFINVLNTIIWVLVNGAKWVNVPKGEQWSPKSTAHDWLGKWQADGTWEKVLLHILSIAKSDGLINWERASIDGAFVAGKGGGEDVQHGYKGKGLTLHCLVDGYQSWLKNTTMAVKIDNNNFKHVGQIIHFHRKKAGLSRINLAMVAGVGKTVIYDIEHGKETVRIKTLLKILNALNITMLLDGPIMEHFTETEDAKS